MTSVEVLLDNYLEPEIQQMIYPLNLMQKICVSSTYNVQDNFITPKGIKYNTLSFITMVILLSLSTYRTYATNDKQYSFYWLVVVFHILYFVGLISLFINSCMYSSTNVLLVLQLQYIIKSLGFNKLKIRKIVRWNWVFICGIVCINLLMFIGYYITRNYFNVVDIVNDFTYIVFNANMIHLIRIMVVLREYLMVWIKSCLVDDRQLEDQNWRNMFEIYKNILSAYNLYKTVFKLMVLHHTVDTFLRSLTYIQFYIEATKLPAGNQIIKELAVFGGLTVIWLGKDLLLLILLSVECEKFYITIEEAENLCLLQFMKTNSSDESGRACLDILLLSRSSFSKMSACGLFDIDAMLPLQLVGLLTDYTVVLLQFLLL